MAYKDPDDPRNAAAKRRHYEANKAEQMRKRAQRRKELRELVDSMKAVPCADCGNRFPPCAMDFHHTEANGKVDGIAQLVNSGSITKLMVEIEKCEIICANCHRIRHHAGVV